MNIEKMISIIIPVYNVEKHLEDCVASISAQTYPYIEMILVDDGSTDSSGQICDELTKTDSRITVIHKKNEGVSIARNTGIDLARGEYIGFVDSDDFCEPDMFQKLRNAMVSQNADIAICGFCDYVNGSKVIRKEPLRSGIFSERQIQDEILLQMVGSPASAPRCAPVMGSLWRCLFKREIIEKGTPLRLKKIKMAEDLVFDVEYLCRCSRAVVLEEALYNYRQFSESSSRRYITDLQENILKLHDYLKETLIRYGVFDDRMQEYYQMTELYNFTWCVSNACKKTNPSTRKEIIHYLHAVRNIPEYKKVLRWSYLKGINWKERAYFMMIKLRLFGLVLWFNRREK